MPIKVTPRWEATPSRRTFACLNKKCGNVFSTFERNPLCPRCGCIRTEWAAPAPGIRHATTTHNDKTLRSLADRHGLTDLGQRGGTHEGERAEPSLPTVATNGRIYEPMPGFRVPWGNRPTAGFGTQTFPGVRAKAGAVRPTIGARPIPTDVKFSDTKAKR